MYESTWKSRMATLTTAAMLAACAPLDVEPSTEAIVDGTAEPGMPAVMLLLNRRAGMCTASLVTPRIVLTARHCVMAAGPGGRLTNTVSSPSDVSLFVGSSDRAITRDYRAREIHILPGSNNGIGDGRAQDIALVVLERAAEETPIPIATSSPSALVGELITAVGYGQTPSGQTGTKYRTTVEVTGYQAGLVFVAPAVCQGDSGGPVIGPDGQIYGVASFIFSPDGQGVDPDGNPLCGPSPGAYNEIYRHLEWIQDVIEEVGDGCFPDEGGEVCDGSDNDCDGEVDEGCMDLGSACTDGATCVGGLCAETQAGRICTQECDPMRPELGCPEGLFCDSTGCAGHCVPGVAGTAAIGAACATDTDCASLFCADPGDGSRRCLAPCQLDAARCLAGEVCIPLAAACGGCVAQEIVSGLPHGLGEPCRADGDCRSGMCRERGGISECVSACGAGGACPDGFTCRESECVRRRGGEIGSACLDDTDCAVGRCASFGERRWCTATCSGGTTCPEGFGCAPAGGAMVCAPMGGLVGERCDDHADCTTGLCARIGGEHVCTQACGADRACDVGFECRRTADGVDAVCAAIGSGGGGCSVGARGGSGGWVVVMLAGIVLARVGRRRRGAVATASR